MKQVLGFEADGVTPRLHEKLGYAYDAANNLTYRTNNQLVATFTSNNNTFASAWHSLVNGNNAFTAVDL